MTRIESNLGFRQVSDPKEFFDEGHEILRDIATVHPEPGHVLQFISTANLLKDRGPELWR